MKVRKMLKRLSYNITDPILHLSKEEWVQDFKLEQNTIGKPYILVYAISSIPKNSEIFKLAEILSIETKLEIINLGYYYQHGRLRTKNVAVEKFLELIYHADYVVTTSYHAVLFSLIFQKIFYAYDPIDQPENLKEILAKLNLTSRYLMTVSDGLKLTDDIPYTEVEMMLQKNREEGKKQLQEKLSAI